jgi:hypothetical protein
MKWLALLGAVGAGAVGVLWYFKGQPGVPAKSPTLVRFASAILSLVLLIAAAYAAHYLGIYSLPLVIVAFLTVGIAGRGLLFGTREARTKRELSNTAPAKGRLEWLVLPLLVVLVVAIAVLGVVVGTLVGRH